MRSGTTISMVKVRVIVVKGLGLEFGVGIGKRLGVRPGHSSVYG